MRIHFIAYLTPRMFSLCLAALTATALALDDPARLSATAPAANHTLACLPVNGAAAPQAFVENGIPVLRLTGRFQQSTAARSAWDFPLRTDLRFQGGIRFKLRVSNLSAFSYFTFYFKSGNGWYVVEFSASDNDDWQTVTIDKSDTRIEGDPSGWRDISAFRISAWRGDGTTGVLDIAEFKWIPARPEVVVVRGTTGFATLAPGEKSSVLLYPRRVVELLSNYGLDPVLVEESDLDRTVLSKAKVLLLPYNPTLPSHRTSTVKRFIGNGGRVIGFYTIPDELVADVGMKTTGGVRAAAVPGGFAAIIPNTAEFSGAPPHVPHVSWIINRLEPMPGSTARPLAAWENADGQPIATPAILATDQALWFSHVLLNETPSKGGRLLLAAIGRFWPQAWRLAATTRQRRSTTDLPYPDFDTAHRSLARTGRSRPRVAQELAAATQARRNGSILLKNNAPTKAIRLFEYAAEHLTEAYFHSRSQPLHNEFKAAWCHDGDGAGDGWDSSVRTLKASGFNVLLANVANAGMAWFPSRHLPPSPSTSDGGDAMRDFVEASQKFGVKSHAWIMCFRLGDQTDSAFVAQLEKETRLQTQFNGNINRLWLCPNNPRNQRMILGAIQEMTTQYEVDGIHLDYIRYPDANSCVCPHCRAEFERFIGHPVAPWPAALRKNAKLATRWDEFRRRSINRFVASVRSVTRRSRPGTVVSAAVFRNESSARSSIAQDWPVWAREKWVDFVCPMNYTESTEAFEHSTARQLRLGRNLGLPVFPGIGLTSHHLGSVGAIQQIEAARTLGARGFVVFQFNHATAKHEFADFAKSATAP